MLRTNETSRVGAVLEHAHAGDRAAMIQAAVELWVTPAEADPERDPAHTEVWNAIVAVGAVDDAVAAVVAVILDGQLVRPHVFIDVGEALGDLAVHRALVERVLATSWDPAWYLAAALMRLVDARQESAAWELVQRNRKRIFDDDATWRTIAVLLTTTRVGAHNEVDDWFNGWVHRRDVPMWLLHAYGSTLAPGAWRLGRLLKLSELALQHATRDATVGFFRAFLAVGDLAGRQYEAFREKMRDLEPELAELVNIPVLDHPVTRFLNRVKHAQPILDFDLVVVDTSVASNLSAIGLTRTALSTPTGAFNKRTGEHLCGLRTYAVALRAILYGCAAVYDLPRNDPKIQQLAKAMARTARSDLPWFKPIFTPLVKQRTSWATRIKFGLF